MSISGCPLARLPAGDDAAGDSDGDQAQEQRRLLQLCDELYYMPLPGSTAGTGSDPGRAALARLRGVLEQQRGLGLSGCTGQLQAGGAVPPASGAGHELALQQPGSGLEPQNAGSLAWQVGSRAAGHQQAQAPWPTQPTQQPSPFGSVLSQPTLPSQLGPLPMSQADDNMPDAAAAAAAAAERAEDAAGAAGIAAEAFPASQQGEAGGSQVAEPGDLLGGLPLLIGTEASQPDPLQQEAAAAEQLLQRELLDLRQRQQERRQQLREERERAEHQRRQREEQVAAQAAAAAEQRQAEQPADDVHREWRLAAASEATFHCVWRLLGVWQSVRACGSCLFHASSCQML